MRITEFSNMTQKKSWNDFLIQHFGSFLQSWEWGEMMKADGRKIWRLALQGDNEKILMSALIIKYDLPFAKSYLYIPRGPVFSLSLTDSFLWQNFFLKIKEIATKENSIFLKIEPQIFADDLISSKFLKEIGFKKSYFSVQPQKTLIVDLSKSAEELLEAMHSKTRYNIRLSRKKGVVIRGWPASSAMERFGIFWRLMRETASRDKIRLFAESRYRRVFEIFGACEPLVGGCELYTAEYVSPEKNNEILAAIFVIHWGETAIYLYGASASRYQNLMASSLIHWEAMLDAKIKGLKHYDFWGIDEKKWPGITRFKKGFGGKEVEYLGTWNYVFKPLWYHIYKLMKKINFKFLIL